MNFLITGALGHIGSRLIRAIPARFPEANVVLVDNLSTQRYCSLFDLPDGAYYRFYEADVLDCHLEEFAADADVVVHLAAMTDAAGSFKNRDQVEQVNYNATRQVAETCAKLDTPMIFASSTSVYGTQRDVVDENCRPDELLPQSPYAETKLREETLLRMMGNQQELRFLIFRFGTICGVSPGMRFHTAVNKFCWQAVMKQRLTVWRTALHQRRPYLDLDDAVGAILFACEQKLFEGNVYNVLTDNLSVAAILSHIEQQIPNFQIEYVDTELMNQLSFHVANERFKKLGFAFQGNLENSIRETIALLKGAGYENGGKETLHPSRIRNVSSSVGKRYGSRRDVA